MNRLAELNANSCSDAVKAAANFFLDTDTYKDFCDDRLRRPTPRPRPDPVPRPRQDPVPRRPAPSGW